MQSRTMTRWLLLVALTTAFSTGAATDGTLERAHVGLNGVVDATDILRVAAGRLKFDERTISFQVIPHGYHMPHPCPVCPPGGPSGSACASIPCSVNHDQCSTFDCGSCFENSNGIPGIGRCREPGTGG